LELLLRDRGAIAIDSSSDMLDQIQHATEGALAFSDLERKSALMREVRAALRRIEAGTFGICVECDGKVTPKRLAALPWTASCINCREAADRSQADSLVPMESQLGAD
jgi:DnaK suppressor protein